MDETTTRHAASGPATSGPAVRGAASPGPRTDRTRIRRRADRAVPDRIEEFLRTGLIAHVSCVEDGAPRVIPFLYHYEAGHIYLHGSPGNSTLRTLRDGRTIVGYVFNRDDAAAAPYLKVFPADKDEKVTVLYKDIAGLAFTGQDLAAENSWAAYIAKSRRAQVLAAQGKG